VLLPREVEYDYCGGLGERAERWSSTGVRSKRKGKVWIAGGFSRVIVDVTFTKKNTTIVGGFGVKKGHSLRGTVVYD